MVSTLCRLFEDRMIEFSDSDKHLNNQLRAYQIFESGPNTIKTSRKNEHIIDALGLACYGFMKHYNDRLTFKPATKVVILPGERKVKKTPQTPQYLE